MSTLHYWPRRWNSYYSLTFTIVSNASIGVNVTMSLLLRLQTFCMLIHYTYIFMLWFCPRKQNLLDMFSFNCVVQALVHQIDHNFVFVWIRLEFGLEIFEGIFSSADTFFLFFFVSFSSQHFNGFSAFPLPNRFKRYELID